MGELCRLLEWDTAFFGFRIARVDGDSLTHERVTEIERWCQANLIRCLYLLACADSRITTQLAEENGFRLVDVRLTFEARLMSEIREPTRSRLATPADLTALKQIAREAYRDTRFYYDVNFPRHLCDSLYETWITRSCMGYADAVLVAGEVGAPLGYITCHLGGEAPAGEIGLVGVSRQAQGQGIAQSLVRDSFAWFLRHNINNVSVVTQARNVAAQRLYQRAGFLTATVNLWYHKWFE